MWFLTEGTIELIQHPVSSEEKKNNKLIALKTKTKTDFWLLSSKSSHTADWWQDQHLLCYPLPRLSFLSWISCWPACASWDFGSSDSDFVAWLRTGVFSFYMFYLKKNVFIYLAMPGLSCGLWDLVPWPRIEPGPLHWERWILDSGPPGKSPGVFSFKEDGLVVRWMLMSSQKISVCFMKTLGNRNFCWLSIRSRSCRNRIH